MTTRELATTLRRYWLLIVIVTLAGVLSGTALALSRAPTYASTAEVFVSTASASSVADLSAGSAFTQQAVKSYAAVATTDLVLERVARDVGSGLNSGQLADAVIATPGVDTVIITIAAQARTPALAARVADSVADNLARAVEELNPAGSSSATRVRITPLSAATLPSSPVGPAWWVLSAIGGLAGLIVSLGIAYVLLKTDRRVQFGQLTHSLGEIPFLGSSDKGSTATFATWSIAEKNRFREAFRSLRSNLQFSNVDGNVDVLLITSSIAGEGKSTSAIQLARAFAATERRTLLIDADLRRPQVANYMGLEGSVGLSEVLSRQVSVEDAIQAGGEGAVFVLPSGAVPPNPSELLQSNQMSDLLSNMRSRFDTVIIDSPPLVAVSDAQILTRLVDGTILIVGVRRVRDHQLDRAVGTLRNADAKVLGIFASMNLRGRILRGADSYQYLYDSAR